MSSQDQAGSNVGHDTLRFAEIGDGIIVLQVHGAGSFVNSVALKKLADQLMAKYGSGKFFFVVDLENCRTMDSTFLGALASIALRQRKECGRMLIVTNPSDHTRKLLTTLGLSHVVEMRDSKADKPEPSDREASFQEAQMEEVSKLDRIVHMIESHEKLCEIDSENEARFQNVLKYLKESLEKEKNADPPS